MSFYKRPRTTQEHRANELWPVRAERGPKRLPNEYDDLSFALPGTGCWKASRRVQYRPAA